MHACLPDEIVDPRDLIRHGAQIRNDFTQHLPRLPVGLKIPHRFQPRPEPILKSLHRLAEITRLPVPLHEFRLKVEKIEMAGRARHEELHHAFGFRRMMQRSAENAGRDSREQLLATEQRGQRDATKPAATLPKKIAARLRRAGEVFVKG